MHSQISRPSPPRSLTCPPSASALRFLPSIQEFARAKSRQVPLQQHPRVTAAALPSWLRSAGERTACSERNHLNYRLAIPNVFLSRLANFMKNQRISGKFIALRPSSGISGIPTKCYEDVGEKLFNFSETSGKMRKDRSSAK